MGLFMRHDADVSIAANHQRTNVTRFESVHAQHVNRRSDELLDGEGNFHAVDFAGIQEAAHVVRRTEQSGTIRSRVAAQAFEY